MYGLKRILFIALFAPLGGCLYATRVYTSAEDAPSGKVESFTQTNLFWGLSVGHVDTAGACATGIKEVKTNKTLVGTLLTDITFGIVSPMHIEIVCKK